MVLLQATCILCLPTLNNMLPRNTVLRTFKLKAIEWCSCLLSSGRLQYSVAVQLGVLVLYLTADVSNGMGRLVKHRIWNSVCGEGIRLTSLTPHRAIASRKDGSPVWVIPIGFQGHYMKDCNAEESMQTVQLLSMCVLLSLYEVGDIPHSQPDSTACI